MNNQVIISISREFGSGGRAIAQNVAKSLNLPLYDRNILSEISNEDGNSYEVKKEHCDVFVKYVVDEKEYKAKLEAGDCKYSVGDSVTIYYDKNDPSKFVSNSIGILIFAVLFSGFGFVLFCFKCIKAYFDTKKL